MNRGHTLLECLIATVISAILFSQITWLFIAERKFQIRHDHFVYDLQNSLMLMGLFQAWNTSLTKLGLVAATMKDYRDQKSALRQTTAGHGLVVWQPLIAWQATKSQLEGETLLYYAPREFTLAGGELLSIADGNELYWFTLSSREQRGKRYLFRIKKIREAFVMNPQNRDDKVRLILWQRIKVTFQREGLFLQHGYDGLNDEWIHGVQQFDCQHEHVGIIRCRCRLGNTHWEFWLGESPT